MWGCGTERAYHSDEWVGPKTYRECETFEQNQGGAGDGEGRTCLAKDGEFTLLPACLVDVSLRWHCNPEMMENRKERWKDNPDASVSERRG
jgi:hypothetical protein